MLLLRRGVISVTRTASIEAPRDMYGSPQRPWRQALCRAVTAVRHCAAELHVRRSRRSDVAPYVEAGSRASQSARKFSGSARSLCPALPITTAVPWNRVLLGQAHLRLGTVAPHLEDSPSLKHSLCLRTVDRAADASRFDPRTAVAHTVRTVRSKVKVSGRSTYPSL